MPITERLILHVKGAVEDWSPAVKILLQTLKTQEGYVRTRWGPQMENMNNLEFLIGWESPEAQKTFQASSDYATIISELKPLFTAPPTVYFIKFEPHAPQAVIDSQYVQLVTFSDVASGTSEEQLRTYGEKAKTMAGCNGVTGGFMEGGSSKLFVAVAGWESLEASAAAKSASADALTSTGGDVESHHVNFRFPVKGFRGL